MTRGMLFWVIMILCVLSWLGVVFMVHPPSYLYHGRDTLIFVLIALLGWSVYGPAIKG